MKYFNELTQQADITPHILKYVYLMERGSVLHIPGLMEENTFSDGGWLKKQDYFLYDESENKELVFTYEYIYKKQKSVITHIYRKERYYTDDIINNTVYTFETLLAKKEHVRSFYIRSLTLLVDKLTELLAAEKEALIAFLSLEKEIALCKAGYPQSLKQALEKSSIKALQDIASNYLSKI
jgi:hypothetical protein